MQSFHLHSDIYIYIYYILVLKYCINSCLSHGPTPHGSKLLQRSFVLKLGQRCSSFVDKLPLMSTAVDYAGYPVGQSYDKGHGMIWYD